MFSELPTLILQFQSDPEITDEEEGRPFISSFETETAPAFCLEIKIRMFLLSFLTSLFTQLESWYDTGRIQVHLVHGVLTPNVGSPCGPCIHPACCLLLEKGMAQPWHERTCSCAMWVSLLPGKDLFKFGKPEMPAPLLGLFLRKESESV